MTVHLFCKQVVLIVTATNMSEMHKEILDMKAGAGKGMNDCTKGIPVILLLVNA